MKRNIFFLFFIALVICSNAQKMDNIWVVGDSAGIYDSITEVKLDFSSGSPLASLISIQPISYFFITDASICDTAGNLLFYTNGLNIYNWQNRIMENGDSISPNLHGLIPADNGKNNISQGALILPIPGAFNKYYLFHEIILKLSDGSTYKPLELFYSIIDMSANAGLGTVIMKNQILISDTLASSKLTAVQHANGKDWWLIAHEYKNNRFIKWLITEDGIAGPYYQKIGTPFTLNDYLGQICFSPDGNKCALMNVTFPPFIDLFDFDRCTGKFSNYSTAVFDVGPLPSYLIGGLALSENNRFMYAANCSQLFQYDLWDTAWQNSKTLVGVWDSSWNPALTYFFNMKLAPDKKIYMSASSGSVALHVINNPDSVGISCDFVNNGFSLPDQNGGTIPNLPWFRTPPYPVFEAHASSDTTIMAGDSVTIGSQTVNGLIYQWQPATNMSNGNIAQPTVFPAQTTTYVLTVTDSTHSGCAVNSDTITVTVLQPSSDCNVVLSNLIATNQNFIVSSPELVTLQIYDMLGRKIFSASQYENDWKPNAAGMYIYQIECLNGELQEGKLIVVQ